MKGFALFTLLTVSSLPALAGDNALAQLNAAAPAAAKASAPAPAPAPAVPAFGLVTWNDSTDPLFTNGSWRLHTGGRTFYIKLGFMRGQYDAAAKTYRARAVLLPYEINSMEEDITNYTLWQLGYLEELDETHVVAVGYGGGRAIHILKIEGNLEAWDKDLNTGASKRLSTIPVEDLYRRWSDSAYGAYESYVEFGGRVFYMKQQICFDNGAIRHGVVVTRDAPLNEATNEPQDYVELFTKTDGVPAYKDRAYSLANAITFRRGPGAGLEWEAWPMKKEEVAAAQNDALGRSRKTAPSGAPASVTLSVRRGAK